MDLKCLIYTSWARPGIAAGDVDSILASARTNNPLEGITGLLIFNGNAFMQILEGAGSAIDALLERLSTDPRHSNMSIRDSRIIEERTFGSWSMAFLRLDEQRFEGDGAVEHALRKDLPQPIRNIILGMTHALIERPAD